MKFDEMADFLEEFAEHLSVKYDHWIFSGPWEKHGDKWRDKAKAIEEFIAWIHEEVKEELVAKRGPKGVSYVEVRRKHQTSPGDPP